MLLAYVDESGDTGLDTSPAKHYALGAILLSDENWLNALDATIAFRSYLRKTYGLSMTAELKAQHLIRGHSSLGKLTPTERAAIYSATMQFIASSTWARAFAIVIDKDLIKNRDDKLVVLRRAWDYTLQRFQLWASEHDTRLMVIHDQGTDLQIRKQLRAMRRFHRVPSYYQPGQTLDAAARRIIEDPSARDSKASYFVQLADLAAYAAVRAIAPSSRMGGSQWNLLGPARIKEVSKHRTGLYGIVQWPR